jgi:hypothetical protein
MRTKRNANAYVKALAERDQAQADRDFLLRFLAELGEASADAFVVHMAAIRAMVSNVPPSAKVERRAGP